MGRRVRWLVLIVVALCAAGVIAALLFVRPDLSDARDRVDATWTPLRAPLATRYEKLDGVARALRDAGAAERDVTVALQRTLTRWHDLALRGPANTDVGVEARTADDLEALARRVRANIAGSAKLTASQPIADALAAFDQSVPPPPAVKRYNRAVRDYEATRRGTVEAPVAAALGYEARPVLVLG
jgi:hypothetical protein